MYMLNNNLNKQFKQQFLIFNKIKIVKINKKLILN